jgi:chromosome segregation ATPase
MSVKHTGINFPNESLAQADKEVLIQVIKHLSSELSDVKSQLSDIRQDTDRNSRDVADVRSEVSEIREDVDRSSKDVADVRGEVKETREDVDRVWKEVADTNGRVSELEEEKTDTDASQSSKSDNNESNSKGSDGQCTALEQVCELSEDESDEHLTANQSRARKVALRIHEYGKSVPAGVAITSTRMRDFLSGLEDRRVHRQSIQRTMDFLTRLGDGHVEKKETKSGKTVVVFTESVVSRIKDVVTGESRDGVTPAII